MLVLLIKFHKVFEMGGGWKRGVRGGAEPEFAALDRMIHVGRDVLRNFFVHAFTLIQFHVFRDTLTVLLQNFLIHVRIMFSGIFFLTPQESSLAIYLLDKTSHLSLFAIVKLSLPLFAERL